MIRIFLVDVLLGVFKNIFFVFRRLRWEIFQFSRNQDPSNPSVEDRGGAMRLLILSLSSFIAVSPFLAPFRFLRSFL